MHAENECEIPANELLRAQLATEDFLICLNALSYEALLNNQRQLYHITPKAHMVSHLSYDFSGQANPRKTQCYSDEDMVGKMKRIMSRCHGATAAAMGLLRYVILVGTRWYHLLAQLRGLS